jgi:hypothetical protein
VLLLDAAARWHFGQVDQQGQAYSMTVGVVSWWVLAPMNIHLHLLLR